MKVASFRFTLLLLFNAVKITPINYLLLQYKYHVLPSGYKIKILNMKNLL